MVVGLVFALSAITKIVSLDNFELYVFSLGISPWHLAVVLSRLLIVAELLLALSYISGLYYKIMRPAGIVMLVAFSIYLVISLFTSPESNCYCFGEVIFVRPLPSLIKNVILTALLIMIPKCPAPPVWIIKIKSYIIGVLALGAVVFVIPHDLVFEGKPVQIDEEAFYAFVEKYDYDLTAGSDKIFCFYSTSCRYCNTAARKFSILASRLSIDTDDVKYVFLYAGEDTEEKIAVFGEKNEIDVSDSVIADPLTFITITEGRLPTIIWTSDGVVRKVFNYTNLNEKNIKRLINGGTENHLKE